MITVIGKHLLSAANYNQKKSCYQLITCYHLITCYQLTT
jgi:hypothetical protein